MRAVGVGEARTHLPDLLKAVEHGVPSSPVAAPRSPASRPWRPPPSPTPAR
ncbi:MAG: hypothetical protein HQL37_03145 [Alphaproteobacteria bacterium]|nr:hypothetical protein [Alphaproteobacteria bacterium]